MGDPRFLAVRLGSMGDVVHAFPAVAALRAAFPAARIDWLVERNWAPLVRTSPDVDRVIEFVPRSAAGLWRCAKHLRDMSYTCAIDFQGLYKSALLAYSSGAARRIGFERHFAREGGAAVFYTQRVTPVARHIVDQNLALAEAAGAKRRDGRPELRIPPEADATLERFLHTNGLKQFIVVSPGGGWRSKCWLPERYGELCRALERNHDLRAVVNYGPGERELAEAAGRAAAPSRPVPFSAEIPELMALLRRARLVVAADTGPLHLAVVLGTPVVGLYGPTDPARNGPYSEADIAVRNARPEETTYKRSVTYSAAMLSITVEQVAAAVERRLGAA